MNVSEFIQLEKPEMFDISSEYSLDIYKNASSCEKYIIYKAYTIDNDWAESFRSGKEFCLSIKNKFTEKLGRKKIHWINDPDEDSELLKDVYWLIWPFMFDEDSKKFWSDTLSSVQYTLSDVFEIHIESGEAKVNRQKLKRKQKCTIRYMLDYFSKKESDEDIMKKIRSAAMELENIPNIDGFLAAWHTIGNYCPVPKGFNSPRSNYGKYDMWDLSLMKIRQWYLTSSPIIKKKIIEEDLFHFNKFGDIKACTKWLERFGDAQKGWENFVNTFLFQDWVNLDDKNSSHYYEVLPLSESHDWENALSPIDDLDEFLINYQNRIFNRGLRIIGKLREIHL